MKNYFIIHGSFSSPLANWFPWLAGEIEKTKPQQQEEPICYIPQFPTGLNFQNYDNWETVLMSYVKAGLFNQETVVFAHSIAPAFICKFLIKNNIKVGRLVFVCGFNNYFGVSEDYDEVNKTMFVDDIKKVKDLCLDIVCFYSNNDTYVPFDIEKSFSKSVANKEFVIENGGHLNAGAGFNQFKQLIDFI